VIQQKSPIIEGNYQGDEVENQGGQREQYTTSSPHAEISGDKDTNNFYNTKQL
jgi:hypothetical protein